MINVIKTLRNKKKEFVSIVNKKGNHVYLSQNFTRLISYTESLTWLLTWLYYLRLKLTKPCFSGDQKTIKGDAGDDRTAARTGAYNSRQLLHECKTQIHGQVER